LVAAAITTAVALVIPWLPVAAGKEAQRIDFVFWFATAIAIGVFSVVAAVLVYSVWKFRAKPGDDSDGPPTHGHTGLEIAWTAVPAVLVTAISIVSAIVLAQNGHAGSNPFKVQVVGVQFAWSFTYPNGTTSGYLTLPEGRHTELDITSKDVIHSFWVPEFLFKRDVIPYGTDSTSRDNQFEITATSDGSYVGRCAELCGTYHSQMNFEVRVVEPAVFDKYVASLASLGQADPDAQAKALTMAGMGACPTTTHLFNTDRNTRTAATIPGNCT
jgi:cytochrome c oxidase subunit II